MHVGIFYVDFRATVTHFVNIFVFLLFFEILGASSIVRVEYSASEVLFKLSFLCLRVSVCVLRILILTTSGNWQFSCLLHCTLGP